MQTKSFPIFFVSLCFLLSVSIPESSGQTGKNYKTTSDYLARPFEYVINLRLGGSFKSNFYDGNFEDSNEPSLENLDAFGILPHGGANLNISYTFMHFQTGITIFNHQRIRLIDPNKEHFSKHGDFGFYEVITLPDDAFYLVRTWDFPFKLGVNILQVINPEYSAFQLIAWGGYSFSLKNISRTRNDLFTQFKSLNVDKDFNATGNYMIALSGRFKNLLSLGLEYQKSTRDYFSNNRTHDWYPGLFKMYIEFEVFNSNRRYY